MTIRSVLKIGNPQLLRIAEPVKTVDLDLKQTVIQDMLDTMQAEKGAGIAAPQIGVNLRIIIFGLEKNPRYPDAEPVPMTILINPEFTPLSIDTDTAWEGCLSVPGYRGLVPRYKHIRYSGLDENGKKLERDVRDFHARVVQHEVDHLNGLLYPHRIRDLSKFGLMDELESAGLIPRVES